MSDGHSTVDAFNWTMPRDREHLGERIAVYCSALEPDNFGEAFFGFVWTEPTVRQHLEPLVSDFEASMLHMLGD